VPRGARPDLDDQTMPGVTIPGLSQRGNGIVMLTMCVKARYLYSATLTHITPCALPSGGDAAHLPAGPHGTEEAPTCGGDRRSRALTSPGGRCRVGDVGRTHPKPAVHFRPPIARLDDDLVPLLLPFALPFCAVVGLSPFRLVQCVQSCRTVKPGTGRRPRGSPSNAERQVRSPTGLNNCRRYGN
jgi:hypothetical protein